MEGTFLSSTIVDSSAILELGRFPFLKSANIKITLTHLVTDSDYDETNDFIPAHLVEKLKKNIVTRARLDAAEAEIERLSLVLNDLTRRSASNSVETCIIRWECGQQRPERTSQIQNANAILIDSLKELPGVPETDDSKSVECDGTCSEGGSFLGGSFVASEGGSFLGGSFAHNYGSPLSAEFLGSDCDSIFDGDGRGSVDADASSPTGLGCCRSPSETAALRARWLERAAAAAKRSESL